MTKQTLCFLILIFGIFTFVIASNNPDSSSYSTGSSSTIYASALLVVSIFDVVSNGIVLFVMMKTDNPNVCTLASAAHMAFWDLIQGLCILIFVTPSAFLDRFAYSESMVSWVAVLMSFLTGVGIFNVVALIADRFISLKWPFYHRRKATKQKYALIACCVYILAFIRTLLISFPKGDFAYTRKIALCIINLKTNQGILASTGPVALSLLAIVSCSCVILREISRRRRRINSEQAMPISNNVIKGSLVCVLTAGLFCLSYLPLILRGIISVAFGNVMIDDIFYRLATVAFFSTGIWNFLIYSVNYKPFREASLKLMCRSYYRKMKRRNQLETAQARTIVSRITVPDPTNVMKRHSSSIQLASVSNFPVVSK